MFLELKKKIVLMFPMRNEWISETSDPNYAD